MAASEYGFRSSMGGFRKSDVTAYIEKTATEHRSELLERDQKIAELQEENRSLQQQLNLLMMATPTPTPAPEPTPVPAPAPVENTDMMRKELQAYRRAEAVERHANNRAKELYVKMEDLCNGALGDFQAADAAVRQTIDLMLSQAATLEDAYQALSAALKESREKISAINDQFGVPDYED